MRILVSGAGVAGPTVAYFLAKAGAQITVVDKAASLLAQGQNIDVQGSSISVIKKMGLYKELRKNNTTEKGTQLVRDDGTPFAVFPLDSSSSPTSEFEILRGDLAKVLYGATEQQPSVKYLFGTTVTDVLSDDDKGIKVELSDGDVREYDAVIIADGQWSRLRKRCFSAGDLTVVDKNMYIAYFTIPRVPSDNDLWNLHIALGSRIVSIRPDPHGTCRAMLSYMPRGAADKAAWQTASRAGRKMQQELVRSTFAGVGYQASRLLGAMETAPDFYFQAIQQVRMRRWHTPGGRVVLLGDAAYCPTPLTAQGAPLAINGAYVLAGEMSRLGDGEHPEKAFEAYERRFRPWVEEQQKIAPGFPAIIHPRTSLQRWLFESFIWTISKIMQSSLMSWFSSTKENDEAEDFKLPHYPDIEKDGLALGEKVT